MEPRNGKKLGDNPIILILGLVSSCLAIFVFVTGYDNLSMLIRQKRETDLSTATPMPLPIVIPTATPLTLPIVIPTATIQFSASPTPPISTQSIGLEVPYIISFEDLDLSKPTEIFPFIFIGDNDEFNGSMPGMKNYTGWTVDSRAHSGKIALNTIPKGNPSTTNAILNPIFNVSNFHTVFLKIWVNTTSNPRIQSVHNCDSSLNVYYKTDSDGWTHKTAICGEHQTESHGWWDLSLDFDVSSTSTIQFAFVYEVQSVTEPDPTVYFLIDDLEITAK